MTLPKLKIQRAKYYSCQTINGMLILLNKIYCKVSQRKLEYLLGEVNDLPGLDGTFVNIKDNDEVIFVPDETD